MKAKFGWIISFSLWSTLAFSAITPWQVRLRAVDVVPYPSSSTINTIGGHISTMSNQTVPEIDASYFFKPVLAVELMGTISRHALTASGTNLGRVGLGKFNMFTPTLTGQYHFLAGQQYRPYVGAGINYAYFYNTSNGSITSLTSYGNSVGPVLQAGLNIAIDEHWSMNLDVKKLYVQTRLHAVTTVGLLNPRITVNPAILGFGIGYQI